MGCCNCFGFSFRRKSKTVVRPSDCYHDGTSQQLLLDEDVEEDVEEDEGDYSPNGDVTDTGNDDDFHSMVKRAEEIIHYRIQKGVHCREFPVKDTYRLIRSEVNMSIVY